MIPLAEGVETVQEYEFLARQRLPPRQGFLFSRPVPAEDVPALAARTRACCPCRPGS
jgi:EAL domain-containing protein (putative c-di-GMP-specific phosphodiesterase class I)